MLKWPACHLVIDFCSPTFKPLSRPGVARLIVGIEVCLPIEVKSGDGSVASGSGGVAPDAFPLLSPGAGLYLKLMKR